MAPNNRIALKNLWVAASDGDLERVKHLIEQEVPKKEVTSKIGMSPNAPDAQTYTPMHAAASYGHINLLEYLVAQGGDVNVTDEDGDTPLYTVETLEVAKWLVENGAIVGRVNTEGISPAQHLEEEFPAISQFLGGTGTEDATNPEQQPSQYAQEQVADRLTDEMMRSVQEVMERAEVDGHDPDQELTDLVAKTLLQGLNERQVLVEQENGDKQIDSSKPSKIQKTSE